MVFRRVELTDGGERAYINGMRYDKIEVDEKLYFVGEGRHVLRLVREDIYISPPRATAVPIKNKKTIDAVLERFAEIAIEIEPDDGRD